MVQGELAKISILNSDILRLRLTSRDLDKATISSVTQGLQDWYTQLPDAMRLDELPRSNLSRRTRTSVCQVHLLHLGARMLLYRRTAVQFVSLHGLKLKGDIQWGPLERAIVENGTQAVLAATQSARLLRFLYDSENLSKRCWITMFVLSAPYPNGTVSPTIVSDG